MKKKILLFLGVFFLCVLTAHGQGGFTTVTGTVTDPNGVEWSCATISAQLITAGGPAPTLNGGGFTTQTSPVALGCPTSPGTGAPGSFAMRLADSGVISPSNTTWRFTVNSTGAAPPLGTGPQSFTFTTAINCATNTPSACASNQMDISTQLSALAPALGQSTTSPSAPCGANTQIQFNDAGVCGADPNFTWTKVGQSLQGHGNLGWDAGAIGNNSFIFLGAGSGAPNGNTVQIGGPGSFIGDGVALSAGNSAASDVTITALDNITIIGGNGLSLRSTSGEIAIGSQTKSGQIDYFGKTSGTANLGVADAAGTPARINLPTTTAPPGAALTSDGGTPQQTSWSVQARACGTTTTCANTALSGWRIIFGSAALSSGTPSAATITGISPAFTSNTSYKCTANNESNPALNQVSVTSYVSGSSFVITGPAANTDTVAYMCIGN